MSPGRPVPIERDTLMRFIIGGVSKRIFALVPLLLWPMALVVPAQFVGARMTTADQCPRNTGFADGCGAARLTGSFWQPSFFTGYTGHTYRYRPPWNVAGVDYPVGYSGALHDPTKGMLPSCATISGKDAYRVTIGSACTISNMDFSLYGGICLSITAPRGSVVLDNVRVAAGPNCASNGVNVIDVRGNADLIVRYSELSIDHTYTGPQALIGLRGDGHIMIMYNAFLSADQAHIETIGTAAPLLDVHNNFVSNIGVAPNHGDWVIGNSSGAFVYNDDYNTVYAGDANATALCYITQQSGSLPGISGHCRHDTLVGGTSQRGVSWLVELDQRQTVNAFDISDNYVTKEISYGYYAAVGSGGTIVGPITCRGNIDMMTGASAIGTVGQAPCN